MAKICKDSNIDLILCLEYETQSKFSLQHAEVARYQLPWLLPSYECSEIENKFIFNQWIKKHNLSQYIPTSRELDQFPYLLKIGNGYGAKYVYIVKNEQDLKDLNFDTFNNQYICQEYIPGLEEYVFHFIAQNGVCIKEKVYKQIFTDMNTDGHFYVRGRGFINKSIQDVVLEPRYKSILHTIVKKINFTGAGCMDFKIHNDKLYIFEFNSRMGGSLFFFDQLKNELESFLSIYKDCATKK